MSEEHVPLGCSECDRDLRQSDNPLCQLCIDDVKRKAKDDGEQIGYDKGYEAAQDDVIVPHRRLKALAQAIRTGDKATAEIELDLIAADFDGWPEAVALGRYNVHTA